METLLVIPLLIFILFTAVQYWGVLTTYQYTQSLKYKAITQMEVAGCLTYEKEEELRYKLIGIGAEPTSIVIDGTVMSRGAAPVMWPGEVELYISFTPKNYETFTSSLLIGGSVSDPVEIKVEGGAISQLAS